MGDKGTASVHLPTPSLRTKDRDPGDGARERRAINILRLFERKRVPGSWKTGALATQGMEPFFFFLAVAVGLAGGEAERGKVFICA